ncbi:MAG TPA: TonB-dependent receptor [Rhizomicrobium sp.]|nr:TonB-dependent receptor [Rhizomicrobium sp.]
MAGTSFARIVAAAVGVFAMSGPAAAEDANPESVLVVGAAPADTLTVFSADIPEWNARTPTGLLNSTVPSVFLSDTESNPFQEDLYFHGFDASPVLGTAEGLAVYQGGTRINQRFGDTVLWDLVPAFAIAKIAVIPGSDPLYGLNALGGAITLQMKSGFDAPDGETVDASGGSFGRARLVAEVTRQFGDAALYLGASAVGDSGWRRSSGSKLYQAYGDYAVRSGLLSAGMSLTLATDSLNENGAVPVQDSRIAAFAIPDTAQNQDMLLQGRVESDWAEGLTLRGSAYLRATHISTDNGEASGFQGCTSNPALLCDDDGTPLRTIGGELIPASVGGDGTDGVETISTTATGATAEMDWSRSILGHDNLGVVGETFDYAGTGFGSATLLGNLTFQPGGTTTIPIGILLGGEDWNIRLRTQNLDEGLYAQDSFALTSSLSVALSGRFHYDTIDLADRLGTALTGDHVYAGLNPGIELTWKAGEQFTAYAEVEQSNRTPTAAELSCANPNRPCLFPLSFISDPGLEQVVARTLETGVKGNAGFGALSIDWSADAFVTRNDNDIIFESSGPFIGSGFFANAGTTQRLGGDIAARATRDEFDVRLSYSYVNATFESAFAELSADNPGADANGEIFVNPGDRMPGIPRSTAKLDLGYAPRPFLRFSLGAVYESSQYLRGDEANLQAQLPGYTVVDAGAQLRLSPGLELYVEGENILDRKYATFGLFGDPTGNGALPQFSNPRFIVPAQPLGFWAGLRKQF